MQKYGPTWVHLHFYCNIHVGSNIHTKVFSLCEVHVTGMVNLSLSLSSPDEMAKFRAALLNAIRLKLRLVVAPLRDPEAIAYRDLVMDTFYGRSFESQEVRVALLRGAAGDWRQGDHFGFRVDSLETTKGEALGLIARNFIPYVAGHPPFLFPRRRWIGKQMTTADLGPLACMHDLLNSASQLYLQSNHPEGAAAGGQGDDRDADGGGASNRAAGPDATVWAEENSKQRTIARDWLASRPGTAPRPVWRSLCDLVA